MHRRSWKRVAAWAGILALALHALVPLAAVAAPATPAGLHDLCGQAPTPAPDGDPKSSPCALCAQPAAISNAPLVFAVAASEFETQSHHPRSACVRPLDPASSRAPPAGA